MTYTDQTTIENLLKRTLTAQEVAILPLIISAVEQYINSEVGSSFGVVAETTRYYDGGSRILEIDTCHEITSVKLVSSDETPIYTFEIGVDFEARPVNEVYKTYLHSRKGRFSSGVANVEVTAKFTENEDVPDDIKYLATYLSSQLFSSNIQGNLKSESIEGYSRTFSDLIENNQVIKMILDKYSKNDILI